MKTSRAVLGLVLLACCTLEYAAEVQTDAQAMMYLSQYGYLSPSLKNPDSVSTMFKETMVKALTEFQSFAGLNVTGHLDDDTLHSMSLSRCGVRDIDPANAANSYSKFRTNGIQGWNTNDLTYTITKYSKLINKAITDEEIRRAFKVWSDITPLTFTHRRKGPVHIDIRFVKGEHDDGEPFDGIGGTLAHAYYPVYGGHVHFDDSEKWTIASYNGTNLFQVAAHEFGHALGLPHSSDKSALMAPFYAGYKPSLKLAKDDVKRIQAIYGAPDGTRKIKNQKKVN